MQFILDHLAAVAIGTVLMVVLMTLSTSVQQNAIDATEVDVRFANTSMLAEIIESDFPNVGAGVAGGDPSLLAHTDSLTASGETITTAFEFAGAVGQSAGASTERVRYELHEVGTVVLGQGEASRTVPTYEIRRLIHDGTAFQVSGRSPATITEFAVRLLDAGEVPVGTTLENARVAEVQFAMAAPFGNGTSFSVSRWQRRFQLINVGI